MESDNCNNITYTQQTAAMQIFPKNSPFYEMPEPIKAAVIKYVFDMGAAGNIGEMDLGSPVLRPVFRQVGESSPTAATKHENLVQ